MKSILFLSLLFLTLSLSAQKMTKDGRIVASLKGNQKPDTTLITADSLPKKLTASDSLILPLAKYEPSVKTELDNLDAESEKLTTRFKEIMMIRQAKMETFYNGYCDRNKIDRNKATVRMDKEGLLIKVRK